MDGNSVVRYSRGRGFARLLFNKRIVSGLVLFLVMCLGIAACSSQSAPAGGATSSTPSSSTPSSSGSATTVSGNSLSGKKLGISVCCPIPEIFAISNAITGTIKSSGSGLDSLVVNGQGSTSKAQQDVQTFMAQGYSAIWTTLQSAEGFQSLAAQAAQQHIIWVNQSGGAVTGATLNILSSNKSLGYAVGVAAAQWMKQNNRTSGAFGVTEGTLDPTNTLKSTGFIAGLHSLLPAVQIYTAVDNQVTTNAGAAVGSDLLQAHPNITGLFGWDSPDAVGLAQAAKEAGKTNPKTFLVATPETDPTVLPLIAAHTIFQIGAETNDLFSSIAGAQLLQKALLGGKIPPTALIRPTLVTSANVAQIIKRDANPQDYPAVANEVLVFSNTPVTTGGPLPDVNVTPIP